MNSAISRYQVFAVQTNLGRMYGVRDSETGAQCGELTHFICRAIISANKLARDNEIKTSMEGGLRTCNSPA